MSIAAIAIAEAPVAAQSLQQPATRKTPVKRKIVAKTDRAVMPEAR